MAKIVLADDEQFIAIAYSDGFRRAGHEVIVANDGEEAMIKIKSEVPDIILTDLIMPKMDGFEVLKAVKNDPKLAHIPVVVLSNLSQPTDEKEVLQNGAVAFLVKAEHSLKQVLDSVNRIVGKQ